MSVSHDFPHNVGIGQPLEPKIVERFGHGLGPLIDRVRVHHDGQGDKVARQEGAVAVTVGTHIYFAANAYRPHTATGRNLIGHELVHVLQQHRSDGPPPGYQSRPRDSFEKEADQIANTHTFQTSTPDITIPTSNSRQCRTAAEQIATVLRNAVEGWGTDEEAIFNALTGRTPGEIAAIETAYAALSRGETLEARLRDELSGDDLSRALSLLRGETAATEVARRLWNAMSGLGTDEEAIYGAVAGRTAEQWAQIQQAFQQMTGENLLTELRNELTDSEWRYINTLLPGAAGGAATAEDRATVIANRIEAAVTGPGTDEAAIYAALTGHSDAELREIEGRFRLLTGNELDVRLREELTDSEYEQVQRLLRPITEAERIARRLREAMEGAGTNESAIIAILTGRSAGDLGRIRAEYQRLYREVLRDRLEEELGGSDRLQALLLEQHGLLAPEDEINVSVSGAGTDEERLFAVLTEISGNRATIRDTIDRYAAKGYGDMLEDIRDDLSGDDLARAMELLHGQTPSGTCSAEERKKGLLAISGAITLAQNAVSELDASIAAGALSSDVEDGLDDNFNPGNAAGAVTVGLAGQVRTVLNNARTDLLMLSDITCGALAPCVANPSCSRFVGAWTTRAGGATIRLCPAFFACRGESDHPETMLHESVHHIGIDDKFYSWQSGYNTLTPRGDGSALDSLDNADSYSELAEDVD
jgi:hypothetical protein